MLAKLLAVGGLVTLGYCMASCNAPDPVVRTHTVVKVIKVPETHIVHDKPDTVTVTKPLPESCKNAARQLTELIGVQDNLASDSGKLLDALSNGARDVQSGDIGGINDSITAVRPLRESISDATLASLSARQTYESIAKQCAEDVKN